MLTPTQAGQILTMVTWLSQVAKSDPDLDRSNDADYMLLVMLLIAFGESWVDIGMDLVMVSIHQVLSKR